MSNAFKSYVFVFAVILAVPVHAARDLLIGGGSLEGVYYQVALHVCNILNKHASEQYNCVGRPALGSVFNINAVDRGLLDFGVAQSDRNWQAAAGRGEWRNRQVKKLRSVFSLHPETVLLVTRKDSDIKSVNDLKGKRVNIGNPGSGQRGNAEDVLRLYGLNKDKDIQVEGLQQSEASRALIDHKIDAFFYTVGNPSAAIKSPAHVAGIRIIPINSEAVKKFVAERPYYVMTAIPANTYKGVTEAVETYAVKATLVTSEEVPEQVVYDLTKTVFTHLDGLRAAHAAFKHLQPAQMQKGLSASLHPGAERYFKEVNAK